MRFLSVNVDSFLIELQSLEETIALYKALQHQSFVGIEDCIPAAKTILVFFNELETSFDHLVTIIGQLSIDVNDLQQNKTVIIPISYQGEDLVPVAELQGMTVSEVINKHRKSVWNVAFIGFAPGFAYLTSQDRPFTDIPRLKTPRKKIPAGSLGLAGQYSGIYPKDSPGGWQLIGSTAEKMWDLERENPALLLPGMSVQFEDVTHKPVTVNVPHTVHNHRAQDERIPSNEQTTEALLKITAPSLQMLIQDEGRFKHTNIGVGTAGAMDQSSMHAANRLVGNSTDTAVIEILNGGFKAKILNATVIAVTGATAEIQVIFNNGQQAIFSLYQAIALECGDEFHIKAPTAGLRNYVAVRGGLDVPPILNSQSFDSLAVLGPEPLKVGDVLHQANRAISPISLYESAKFHLPQIGDIVDIDVMMGPRTDWFEENSIAEFFQQTWQVTNESNRVGLRLLGETPLVRKITHELESEGTAIGALQIPPSGQPVLFMNDHPLTGGYPVLASVAKYHWDLIAQIPAGCFIQFRKVADLIDIES
jgi:KipI family sensor histidine kinase inhibitor